MSDDGQDALPGLERPRAEHELCGWRIDRAPAWIESCPRETGHDGDHVMWQQSAKPGQRRGRNGVGLYDQEGKAIAHITFEGYVTAEEVGALATFMAWKLTETEIEQAKKRAAARAAGETTTTEATP